MVNDLIDDFFTKRLITAYQTRKSYQLNINKYFRLINKDMNTYFSKKKKLSDFDNDLNRIYIQMEKQNVPLLTRKTFFNSVKQFLCTTDKRLKDLDFWDTLKNRMRGASPQSEKDVPNTSELRVVLSHGNTCSRAMFLMQASMGARIGEILALYPDDIDTKTSPTKVIIRRTYSAKEKNYVKNLTKTKKSRVCFISNEATKAYLEWMKERDAYLRASVKKSKYEKNPDDKRIFPMSDENAREIWERLIKRSGFFKKDIETNRLTLHPHCLRAFFRTYLGHADLAEHLMGHATGMDKYYRNMKPEDLAKEYIKYMGNLAIFEQRADISGISDELKIKDEEIAKLNQRLDTMRVADLESEVRDLHKLVKGLESIIYDDLNKQEALKEFQQREYDWQQKMLKENPPKPRTKK
jgi:integrase